MIILYGALLVCTIINIKVFLIAERKYKIQPMLVFYIAAVLLAVIRIFGLFFSWYFYAKFNYSALDLPIVMTIICGIE